MNMTLLLFLSILIFMSVLEIYLIHLNVTTLELPLDQAVKDIYDKKGYERFVMYTLVKSRFNIGSKFITLLVNLLFFLLVAPRLSSFLISFNLSFLIYNLTFLVIVLTLQSLIKLPINWLNVIMIEKPFGFSTTTFKLWVQDKVKGATLFLIIGLPIVGTIIHLINTNPTSFILTLWLGSLGFILITQLLYVPVIIPLFNKLTPLPDGLLRNQIHTVAKKANYDVKKISIINASKRSNRANAFFTGFGRFKHIILFDTLLTQLSDEQVLSVLAHEIGHAKHKDVLKLLLINALNIFIIIALLQWLFIAVDFASTFNVSNQSLIFKFMVFFVLIEPFQILSSIITSKFSRKMETKADEIMVSLGFKHASIEAFKILGRVNFVHLNPHPLVVNLTYSHPPLKDRIKTILKQTMTTSS